MNGWKIGDSPEICANSSLMQFSMSHLALELYVSKRVCRALFLGLLVVCNPGRVMGDVGNRQ